MRVIRERVRRAAKFFAEAWSAPTLAQLMYRAAILKNQGIDAKIVLVLVGDEWRAELRISGSEGP